jgi:acetyl esterase/lipase
MNEPAPPADERVAYGDQLNQFIDFRYPAKPRGLAVYIHGGFWRARIDLTHAGHVCAALTAAGFVTASVEYRRAGEEGGGWPGTLDDVRHGIAFARNRFFGTTTILLGHSAGGHLALCMAAEMPDLHGVFALGPVSDPRRAWELNLGNGAALEFFGGGADEFPERYLMLPPICPVTLIHGTADDIVPVTMSRGYRHGQVIELEGADHFDVIDPESPYFPRVLEALE